MVLIGIGYNWQQIGIAYAFGFRGLGDMHNNPVFEISNAYPAIVENYGWLSGLAIYAPTAIIGIFMGQITDNTNRVKLLGTACILWSLTTYGSGAIDSFEAFCLLRVLLGIFSAACNPPALGLIRDYFPPQSRTFANSLYLASDYLGCCFSSLSIILIKNYGWREDYEITGLIGILSGIAALIYLEEPMRGKFERMEEKTLLP